MELVRALQRVFNGFLNMVSSVGGSVSSAMANISSFFKSAGRGGK